MEGPLKLLPSSPLASASLVLEQRPSWDCGCSTRDPTRVVPARMPSVCASSRASPQGTLGMLSYHAQHCGQGKPSSGESLSSGLLVRTGTGCNLVGTPPAV